MTQLRLHRIVPIMSCLFAWGAAWAGSDMFGSLPGRLIASAIAPQAGQTVTVTLELLPTSSASGLRVRFDAPGCAVLTASAAGRGGVSLVAGHPARFSTQARITRAGPCKIVASVVQIDEAAARTGWVYALVLNEAPAPPSQGTPGRDAEGRPTIDAVTR